MIGVIDHNSLSVFAEAGLLIFFTVFLAVTVRALRAPRRDISACARMPLDETGGVASDTKSERGAS